MTRQSEPELDVIRTRQRFSESLRLRLIELGVKDGQEKWLHDHAKVRWQTAQAWLTGKSFPMGHNLAKLATVLGVTPSRLLGPISPDLEPKTEAWRKFVAAPEGASMSDDERWALVLFAWPKPARVSDYRSLLSLLRANAENAA